MTDIDLIYDAAQMAERREQRRYEIAKELLVHAIKTSLDRGDPEFARDAPSQSCIMADALLAELERTK